MGIYYRVTCLNDGDYVDLGKSSEFEGNFHTQARLQSFLLSKVNLRLLVTSDESETSSELLKDVPKGSEWLSGYDFQESVNEMYGNLVRSASVSELKRMAGETLKWKKEQTARWAKQEKMYKEAQLKELKDFDLAYKEFLKESKGQKEGQTRYWNGG